MRNEAGFGEYFHQEHEPKINRVEIAENEVSKNDPELEVSKGLSETQEFRDFIANKKQFGVDTILYCDGILDYLKKEFDKGLNTDDLVLVFPGRSGLGIEFPVRESTRETFGRTPMSVRMATESDLEGNDFLTLSRTESFKKVPIQYRQEGNILEWDRDKVLTPQLDDIFKKPKEKVLVCDTCKAGGRSLRQILFALKPYKINNIVFATAFLSCAKLRLGETLVEPNSDVSKENQKVDELLIAVNNWDNFDHIARRVMWLSAGITKIPTNQESLLKLDPNAREIQKRIDEIPNSFDSGTNHQEAVAAYEEYCRLYNEREALADATTKTPPPLEFVKGPINISNEDRAAIRFYLRSLGHLSASIYKSS